MQKIELAPQGTEHGLGHDPRTDHLRPVIDFLLAKGNRPSHWWHESGFWSDQGGELHYSFTDPIDAAELREHFDFPPSIQVYDDGHIKDGLNRFDIYYDHPPAPWSFELTPEHTLLPADTPLSPDPPVVGDGKADELLSQLIAAGNARKDARLE